MGNQKVGPTELRLSRRELFWWRRIKMIAMALGHMASTGPAMNDREEEIASALPADLDALPRQGGKLEVGIKN